MQYVADAVLRGEPALDLGDVARGGGLGSAEGDDGQVGGGHVRRLGLRRGGYQACVCPHCGQPTVVVTLALNA